jgi:hypothetical protein
MPRSICFFFIVTSLLLSDHFALAAKKGVIEIRALDAKTKEPLAVRMHLVDQKGKPVKPPKTTHWHDHFAFQGSIKLELPSGNYHFELERGLEYKTWYGKFFLEDNASDSREILMERFTDMAAEGWFAGDLDIQRSPSDIELLMQADELHIAPVTTWSNTQAPQSTETSPIRFDKQRFYQLFTGRDEREGGGLLLYGLAEALPLQQATKEYPSGAERLQQAKAGSALFTAAQKANAWDLPVWIATGHLNSVLLANLDQQRDGFALKEVGGRPRDAFKFANPYGVGRWNEAIYYHLLNCGLRLPPAAGSGSGAVPNPLGYNRVYVHCEGELTWEKWWQGLKQGRVVVTNGPLLTPRFNGELPGHVFQVEAGKSVEISVALNLFTREKIDYLELVQNGQVVEQVRLDKWAAANGVLPLVKFEQSGWLLVRAVTNNSTTYRYATSGPVYVEVGYEPRISKSSAQFFNDWVVERVKRIKLEDPTQREAVIEHHRHARDYWKALLEKANVE